MTHQIRKNIILHLIHHTRASFNELWNNQGESNAFAYHLKRLEEEGVVQKYSDGYGLTPDGQSLITDIEGDTGNKTRFPTPTVIIVAQDAKGRILAQQRKKEPYHGYWAFPSGKINFGWNPEERAKRDLYEETGLTAGNIVLRGIEHVKTIDDGTLLHHHTLYVYQATNCTGELIKETHKAKHAWMSTEEFQSGQRLPGDWLFEFILPSKNFFIIEGERYMKEGVFTGETKAVSVKEYELCEVKKD